MFETLFQCNLASFAQFVSYSKVCDGVYHCLDRSDESLCNMEIQREPNNYNVWATSFGLQRAFRVAPRVTKFQECQLPQRMKSKGIKVGNKCRRYKSLLHRSLGSEYIDSV